MKNNMTTSSVNEFGVCNLHVPTWVSVHEKLGRMWNHFASMSVSIWRTTWRHHQIQTFPRYWPFVRGIHRSPVNSPHKGQWRGALMFSLIYVWINGWVNNRESCDLRRHRTYYDVTVTWPERVIGKWLTSDLFEYMGVNVSGMKPNYVICIYAWMLVYKEYRQNVKSTWIYESCFNWYTKKTGIIMGMKI